jgi:hypothetical protein
MFDRDVAGRTLPRFTLLEDRLYEKCDVTMILDTLHKAAYR